MKNEIEFTQYLRPDGRTRKIYIERPVQIVQMARVIQTEGCCFECEVLMDGTVSLTISDGERDLAGELCKNGPAVPETIDQLIKDFYGH